MIADRTTYLARADRDGYGRDCTHRPARWDDAVTEAWETGDDSRPSAVVYRAATLPGVEILRWTSTGTFTTVRNVDGIRASIDASTWFDAVSAAYAYAGWDNPYYA